MRKYETAVQRAEREAYRRALGGSGVVDIEKKLATKKGIKRGEKVRLKGY